METQLDMEKNKVEQEKKKLVLAHDQISQLVRMRQSVSSISDPRIQLLPKAFRPNTRNLFECLIDCLSCNLGLPEIISFIFNTEFNSDYFVNVNN